MKRLRQDYQTDGDGSEEILKSAGWNSCKSVVIISNVNGFQPLRLFHYLSDEDKKKVAAMLNLTRTGSYCK